MNCKPGDLAIIVWSHCPENIGRIVEVIRPAIRGIDFFAGETGNLITWVVKADRPLVRRGPHYEPIPPAYERSYLDDCLRPVTGLPITDDVTDEVTI
jgi:hypothetical protein